MKLEIKGGLHWHGLIPCPKAIALCTKECWVGFLHMQATLDVLSPKKRVQKLIVCFDGLSKFYRFSFWSRWQIVKVDRA